MKFLKFEDKITELIPVSQLTKISYENGLIRFFFKHETKNISLRFYNKHFNEEMGIRAFNIIIEKILDSGFYQCVNVYKIIESQQKSTKVNKTDPS